MSEESSLIAQLADLEVDLIELERSQRAVNVAAKWYLSDQHTRMGSMQMPSQGHKGNCNSSTDPFFVPECKPLNAVVRGNKLQTNSVPFPVPTKLTCNVHAVKYCQETWSATE